MDALRTILVPIDFTRASQAAFEAALRLRHDDTAVIVVHVIDERWVEFAVDLGYAMPDEIEAKARTHAESHMRRLTESAGDSVERVVTIGRPVEKLLDLARELAADLVVLGRPSMERTLPGTVAEQILRFAPCAVLTIPGETGIADMETEEVRENAPSGAPSAT